MSLQDIWRVLYVKCFSFLIIFISLSWATDIELRAISNEEVSFGDIVDFKVEGNLEYSQLSKYENKRINDKYYNLEVYKNGDNVFFKSIISQMEKGEKIEVEDKFEIHGVNFKFKKIQLDERIKILDENIILKRSKEILIFFFVIFTLIILFFSKRYLTKRRTLLKRKLERTELNINMNNPTREDLEKIYAKKSKLVELYDFSEELMDDYLLHLNKYQFQKEISKENLTKLILKYKEVVKSLKAKDGI